MDLGSSLQDLQQTEAECLRRFRRRACRLMAADPRLKKDIAFAKAVHELPKTANLYQRTRHLLAMAGVRALRRRMHRGHRAAIADTVARGKREQEAKDAAWAEGRARLRPVTLLPLGDFAAQLETEAVQAAEAEWRRRLGTVPPV